MKIHEYQARELLIRFNVATTGGEVATTPQEARAVAEKLRFPLFVVKAQIHAGGRGKGGGIKLARTPGEVEDAARQILGMRLVTHQTGPEGRFVQKVFVQEGVEVERELYVGMVLDRATSRITAMVSTEGGVEIEQVAAESPDKISKETMDPRVGMLPFQARKLAYAFGLSPDQVRDATKFLLNLYDLYTSCDASLAEINPLAVTKDGRLVALDAKINLDDNALWRHKDLAEWRDPNEEEPAEVEAGKYNLSYIKLDGNVGCMVNGAGLAMATMDIIKLAGGEPANFLDVGGSASVETVKNGFGIILSDPNVKAVLINIFGGIVRCDRVANGVIEAVRQLTLDVPVVVRLEGTNAKEAAEILRNSDVSFVVGSTLRDAAEKVVAVAGKAGS
jgi:succinyl-CoA synthetase beta subunit